MDPIRRVNTTMPESLLRKIDFYSKLNWEDRATAIRQLVAEGLRVKLEQAVLDQFRKGKLTIRQGAELLGVTYLEMDELLRENGVALVSDISLALRRAAARSRRKHKLYRAKRRAPA